MHLLKNSLRAAGIVLLLITCLASTNFAQVDIAYYLPSDITYDQTIPTPEEFFGFQIGEWHLRHDQLIAYLQELDRLSNRITIEEYGRTYEQRPLMLLTISSPAHQSRIHEIRAQHSMLCDPKESGGLDIENMPAVVWLGYSVHGNEPSGSNAVPLIAYYLAAGQGEAVESMLNRMVILLDPSFNPDGFSRFAHWANTHKGNVLVADPNHREHREDWPSGRTNHYWFDLNRDWLLGQHPESRGRLAQFHQWKPNVLTDHHEMQTNNTFFFQPGIPSRNHPLTPKRTFELTHAIAQFHAQSLNVIGSLYYSEESFDDFYVGKGSTYPDINGAVGILFEQASSRGHVQESVHGDVSFPFTIRNQITASLSTLQAAQQLRVELLQHQREFYISSLHRAAESPVKAYVFGTAADPVRTYHLLELLQRHHIQVYNLNKHIRIEHQEFVPGSAYVAPAAQPQMRLLTALFEKRTTFRDSLFYDVSSWTIPLAFHIPYAELTSKSFSKNLLGALIENADMPKGKRMDAQDPYAYLFEWHGYYAPRALYRLLKEDVKVKVATKPFEISTAVGRQGFDFGTILIPAGIQSISPVRLQSILNTIAAEDGIDVIAVETGLASEGIDLGSPSFKVVSKPNIMIVTGSGLNAYDAGTAWHLLDQRFHLPVSLVKMDALNHIGLHRYTVIIMPEGSYTDIDSAGIASLHQWVQKGGTLIVQGSAARWAARNNLAAVQFKKGNTDSATVRRAYVDGPDFRGAQVLGGAIFEAYLDRTHPIGYGYDTDRVSVFRRGTLCMEPSSSPYATPLLYTEQPLLSGYISPANVKKLENSAALVVSKLGDGRVIAMMDKLNFRAFWYGTNKLFLNCIFFGPVIDSSTL